MTYEELKRYYEDRLEQKVSNACDAIDSNPDLSELDCAELYEYVASYLKERADAYRDEYLGSK
jgi:hypothetical protein